LNSSFFVLPAPFVVEFVFVIDDDLFIPFKRRLDPEDVLRQDFRDDSVEERCNGVLAAEAVNLA